MVHALTLSPRAAWMAALPAFRARLSALLLLVVAVLTACGGGGSGGFSVAGLGPGTNPLPAAPAGLSYAMNAAVYEVAQPIVPNRPTIEGGTVDRYTISPALPTGLAIDTATGVISGTPAAVVAATAYTVTAANAGGSTTARLQIEVRQTPAAPAGLAYRDLAPVYTVGEGIAPNTPTSSGGPISRYEVTPPLPAGLALNPQTGGSEGTPTTTAPAADHVVIGSNAAGSVAVTLRVAVQAAVAAPLGLAYTTTAALYVTTEAIAPNTAQTTGGPATNFSVVPALPAGLTLNATNGTISGTPTALQAQATYTLTASNSAGSAQAQLRIGVTSRGSWSPAPDLAVARHYATSVKLASGKVLLIGGFASGGPTNLVSVYDAASDNWSAAAPMLSARADASATLLLDGRVLVAGGDALAFTTVASAEIYDPVANTWTATGSMAEARTRHSATLLPDGTLMVIGGYRQSGGITFSQSAERYDVATGTWATLTTPLSEPRGQHGAQLLPGGSAVLLIGGVNRSGFVTSAELFPVNDSGSTTTLSSPLPAGNVCNAVALADGSVLAMTDGGTLTARFHPATSSWTTAVLAGGAPRTLPTMNTLSDGRVLLAGGGNLATAEVYNPDADVWTLAAPMSTARRAATASLMDDGSVLVIGGFSNSGEVASVERYMP
jgi:N-acetylneuraminic acid mutarotase